MLSWTERTPSEQKVGEHELVLRPTERMTSVLKREQKRTILTHLISFLFVSVLPIPFPDNLCSLEPHRVPSSRFTHLEQINRYSSEKVNREDR